MKENFKELLQREFDVNETLMVLKTPITIYWSWGVSKLLKVEDVGLILKVNGHHHKDFVLISLAWNDTYIVSLLDKDYKPIRVINDVYFDVLQSVVDKEIEYIEDYK